MAGEAGKADHSEVASLKPEPVVVKETTRQAMSSIMTSMGMGAESPEVKGVQDDDNPKGNPNPDSSGDKAGELNPADRVEGEPNPRGDPGEQQPEAGAEGAGQEAQGDIDPDDTSVEGVDDEINLLEELNSMAAALQAQKTGIPPEPSQELPADEPTGVQETVAPFTPKVEFELSDDDFNKALTGADGFKNVVSKAVEQGVASSQQSMLQALSMAVGKVVAETVERAVEYSNVKQRHPIVSKYPDAFTYAAAEVQAANPEWSRDKVLSHAVARLKLYEKAKSRQVEGQVIDTDARPSAAPTGGASVRQKVSGKKPHGIEAERDALIAHIEAKEKRRTLMSGA